MYRSADKSLALFSSFAVKMSTQVLLEQIWQELALHLPVLVQRILICVEPFINIMK